MSNFGRLIVFRRDIYLVISPIAAVKKGRQITTKLVENSNIITIHIGGFQDGDIGSRITGRGIFFDNFHVMLRFYRRRQKFVKHTLIHNSINIFS
jgi:hypothetical protein